MCQRHASVKEASGSGGLHNIGRGGAPTDRLIERAAAGGGRLRLHALESQLVPDGGRGAGRRCGVHAERGSMWGGELATLDHCDAPGGVPSVAPARILTS